MRINSAAAIALARTLYAKHGSWKAVRAAIAMEARQGPDRATGLDGEAATARPEGIAQ